MIMSFLTFFLSYSQLFAKGRFTGLSFVWHPLTCHSYEVGALHSSPVLDCTQSLMNNTSVSYPWDPISLLSREGVATKLPKVP